MDRIKVTEEMRERILDNIADMDIEPDRKSVNWSALARHVSIAACVVAALCLAIALPRFLKADSTEGSDTMTEASSRADDDDVQTIPDIVQCASAAEMSEKLGFVVTDISSIPFKADTVEYYSYWGYMAEITYTADDNSVTYRKAKADGDISGDYSVYPNEKIEQIGDVTVTLKGEGGQYVFAVWQDGDFAYSLYIEKGVDYETFALMIESAE